VAQTSLSVQFLITKKKPSKIGSFFALFLSAEAMGLSNGAKANVILCG